MQADATARTGKIFALRIKLLAEAKEGRQAL